MRAWLANSLGARLWVIVGLLGAAPAMANYTCQGVIDSVALNQAGTLTITSTSSGLNTFYVCQIANTFNGVGPEVCKAIYAQMLAARVSGQNVTWYFSDALSCTTHPVWDWLTGWYFGPQLAN